MSFEAANSPNPPTSIPAAADQVNVAQKKDIFEKAETKPFPNGLFIQPKLTVGAPDDQYEKEADAVADKVMRMPEPPFVKRKATELKRPTTIQKQTEEEEPLQLKRIESGSFIQKKCAECEQEEEDIQRKPVTITPFLQPKSEGHSEVHHNMANSIASSKGSGEAIDADTQFFMSSRFAKDFSAVKIHTDSQSVQFNRELNAKAFTVGQDVYFNEGQYQPNTSEGKQLLAHELTHVVQQGAGKMVQKTDWPVIGGSCCNRSENTEWALVGEGVWEELDPDSCTDFLGDCDGMTCGGGFYSNHGWRTSSKLIGSSACTSPRNDSPYFRDRRWTPTSAGSEAMSPTQRGSIVGDTPPGYEYDS